MGIWEVWYEKEGVGANNMRKKIHTRSELSIKLIHKWLCFISWMTPVEIKLPSSALAASSEMAIDELLNSSIRLDTKL